MSFRSPPGNSASFSDDLLFPNLLWNKGVAEQGVAVRDGDREQDFADLTLFLLLCKLSHLIGDSW